MTTLTDSPGAPADHQQPEHQAQPAGPTEVVDERAAAALALAERQRAGIEAAAGAALMPGVPGREEFLNLCLQAKLLSMSAALQAGLRDNPHLCLHIVLIARALGIDPASAVNLIDYIPDDRDHPERGGQLSLSPEFLCGQIKRMGLGKVDLVLSEPGYAVAVALEPGGRIVRDAQGTVTDIIGEIGRSDFDWDQAKQAGLVDIRCNGPYDHWVKQGTRGRTREERCECRQGYRTYPKRMMGWRAKGYAAHDHFPEASVGLYSPEELGAVVDEQGRMIDPATVELPAGYEPAPPPEVPRADPADLAQIRADIAILDDEGRSELREQWAKARIRAVHHEDFSPSDANKARSLLNGVITRRRRAGWDDEAARNAAIHRGVRALMWWMATAPPEPEAPRAQAPATQGQDAASPPAEAPDAPTQPEAQAPAQEATQGEAPPAGDDEPRVPSGMSDDEVANIIERVKRMKPDEVIAALSERGKPTTGNQAMRGRRLTAVMCQEHAEAEAAAAGDP